MTDCAAGGYEAVTRRSSTEWSPEAIEDLAAHVAARVGELLAEAPTPQALLSAKEVASLHGAHFLGADKDLGSLEVGKLADLMVLNSNPLDNIKNTLDMKYVMKGGKLYDAMSLDEIWPKAIPFGPYYWVNDDMLQQNTKATDIFDKAKKP